MKKLKIALYARVSTDDQLNENQEPILKEFAKFRKWDWKYFEEKASTRKIRPIKENILKRILNNEFDGVCIVRIDRWARTTSELIKDATELTKREKTFVSINEMFDLSTSVGRHFFRTLASGAEYERDRTSERTIDGLDRIKRAIEKHGYHISKRTGEKIYKRGRPPKKKE